MRNCKFAALLLAGALLLPVALSACQEQKDPAPSSSSSVAGPTEAPSEEPSSSKPESEVKASPDPEPTEAPAQTGGFEAAFDANPIDAKLAEDLDAASSGGAILKAYEAAGKYWRAMVPIAYDAAKAAVGDDDRAQLDEEQKAWEDTIDGIVDEIKEKNSEGSDGKITAARLIQERYRETVRSLCEVVFAGTGELPDFAPAMSDAPVG